MGASQINFSSLNLNPEEARTSSEMVFESVFENPSLESVHDIKTGVIMDKYIPIIGSYGLVGKASAGDCSRNTELGPIPVSEKQWTPKLVDFRLPHCQAAIPDLLKAWGKSMNAAKTWEDVDSEMMAFIQDEALKATMKSILRISSFGDTAATTYALGGQIKDAATLPYFTILNGLWKQIFTGVGALTIKRVTIAANQTHTQVMGTDVALTTMRSMYNQIDAAFFSKTDKIFEVTKSFYDNYVDTLEAKSVVFSLDETINGVSPLKYRGVPIVVRYDWDENIAAYLTDDVTVGGASPATVKLPFLPNRAILTTKSNIPIGTSDTESMSTFDSFYDKKDSMWYLDVAYKLDLKILEEKLIVAAY